MMRFLLIITKTALPHSHLKLFATPIWSHIVLRGFDRSKDKGKCHLLRKQEAIGGVLALIR